MFTRTRTRTHTHTHTHNTHTRTQLQYTNYIQQIPATPKVITHTVGVQVGGIFLEPKMISLPNKTNKQTSNVGIQCIEDEPPKSEIQIEHEAQVSRLKSSLQVAYKVNKKVLEFSSLDFIFSQEISEMQCLIEELQSQVLPSPEPHRSEGEEEPCH